MPMTGCDGIDDTDIERAWVDKFDEYLYVRTSDDLKEYDWFFSSWYPGAEMSQIEKIGHRIEVPIDLLPSVQLNFVDQSKITDRHNRSYAITEMLDDEAGNLWLGSWGFGAAIAGSSARQLEQLPYGLIQQDIRAIHFDGSNLWVGGRVGISYRTGLSGFNLENNSFEYLESGTNSQFPASDVYSIESIGENIAIGTEDGLYLISGESDFMSIERYSRRRGLADNGIMSLAAIGDSLFIGTVGGLNLLTLSNDSVQTLYPGQFNNQTIYDLECDGSYLWIASIDGAYRLNLSNNRMQKFDKTGNILFGAQFDIELEGDNIWFVSDHDLIRFDQKKGEIDSFDDLSRVIYGHTIVANELIAAVASDRGLIVIFLKAENRFAREFTFDDGLASDNIYALWIDGDYIWIGTDRGLTRFLWNNPERID